MWVTVSTAVACKSVIALDRARQSWTNWDRTGQSWTDWDRAGQSWTELGHTVQHFTDRTLTVGTVGLDRTEQGCLGYPEFADVEPLAKMVS